MKKVFTSGTYDAIHYGHINLLSKAKELGDYLIVGLNVTKNGKETYFSYEERKKIIESIKYVDEVVPIYNQEDKFKYLKDVDIFAIGSDYIGFDDIEEIRKYAEVKFIERTPNISSTQLKKYLTDKQHYNTFVIDIDDTISITYNRDFENSVPIQPVIEKINKLHEMGWKIILFTARGINSCGYDLESIENKYRDVTEKWLIKNNVQYDELIFRKPNADYYVDDKNISVDEFINSDYSLRRENEIYNFK